MIEIPRKQVDHYMFKTTKVYRILTMGRYNGGGF